MEAIDKVAQDIVSSFRTFLADDSDLQKAANISLRIRYYFEDVFKLINNINNTSLNEADKEKRFAEIETKYGIPIKHLL